MSSISRDAAAFSRQRVNERIEKTMGAFKVATITPTFTVYLDGSTTAVPALKLVGQTFAVDDTGIYWLRQGQLPVCGRTTA